MAAEMGPGPDVEHHHHHETGHKWLDITLAVSAVFISLISLVLAIQHGHAMEKMVEVSSWPYVVVQNSNANRDGTPHVSLSIVNNGVGPAKLESVEVFYNGVAQTDAQALLRAMLKITDPQWKVHVLTSDVIGSVIPARDQILVLDVLPGQLTDAEYQVVRVESNKLSPRVCYCSVFDECWSLRSEEHGKPESVRSCPVPKTMFGK